MNPGTHQVCDNCRLRKIRCDRGRPCSSCLGYSITCQYRYSVRRRGPRGGNGRRLKLIRLGLADDVACPGPHVACGYDNASTGGPGRVALHDLNGLCRPSVHTTGSTSYLDIAAGPQDVSQCAEASCADLVGPRNRCMNSTIAAHVDIFMTYIFPIMPAVDGAQLISDATNLQTLPVPRYALLLALCAITRIQLRLDQENPIEGDEATLCLVGTRGMSGVDFLAAAEQVRSQFTLADGMSQEAILTSFFLFVSYANIEKYDNAWVYLSQSICMAMLLGYDREPPDVPLSPKELNMRRKIFWLLFVTERTFALQRRMPLLLRGGVVPKPEVLDSDCVTTMNDFLNHIRLFESLPTSLYDWKNRSGGSGDQRSGVEHSVDAYICSVEPGNAVMESQYFDTLITKQWLRVSMWRLVFGMQPKICDSKTNVVTPTLPFDAGKSIMGALACVSNRSKDCHGLSIEQKLYDIGISLVDVSSFTSAHIANITLGTLDLLYAIVRTLGCMRGRQSRYLPSLLSHAQFVLGLDTLPSHGSLSLLSYDDNTQELVTEVETDEPMNELFWHDNSPILGEGDTEEPQCLPTEHDGKAAVDNFNWIEGGVYTMFLAGT